MKMTKVLLAIFCAALTVAGATAQHDDVEELPVILREVTVSTTTQSSEAILKTMTTQSTTSTSTTVTPTTVTPDRTTPAATTTTEAPTATKTAAETTTLLAKLQLTNSATATSIQATTSQTTTKPVTQTKKLQTPQPRGESRESFTQPKLVFPWDTNTVNLYDRFPVKTGSFNYNNHPYNNNFPNLQTGFNRYHRLQLERERYLQNILFGGLFFDWLI